MSVFSRLLVALAVLGVWPVPPCKVDPQAPGSVATPNLRDSLRLANILLRRPLGPRSVRRECRMLNATEFDRITRVINRAKSDTRIRPTVYDAFAYLHTHPDVNAGAHQGPGFLPFHRVLIFLFEKMLRLYDPSVSLCYWDSTLEPLDMTNSATWTSALFGNNMGTVRTGFAADWLTPLGPLIRDGGRTGRPFRQRDIDKILEREALGLISFPGGNVDSNLEEKHNYVHAFVGGLMGQVETASYDPIFWFHHTFVDCVYEWFRQSQVQRGFNPMRDWPAEYGSSAHAPYAAMRLGSLRMIDGTNNFFAEQTLQCLDSARSCRSNSDCGDHMRCQTLTGRCVSDTLAITPGNIDQEIHHLESLFFNPKIMMNSINRFLNFPARGFNHLFGTPNLHSFTSLGDSSTSAGSRHTHGQSGGLGQFAEQPGRLGQTAGQSGDVGQAEGRQRNITGQLEGLEQSEGQQGSITGQLGGLGQSEGQSENGTSKSGGLEQTDGQSENNTHQ